MTFDEWFQSKQGEPYDSMYVFAKDAWAAARKDAFAVAAEHAKRHGKTLSVINDNEAMEFAGKAIGDSIFPLSK